MRSVAVLVLLVVALVGCGYSEEEKAQGKHCEFNTYYFEQAMERQYGLDFDLDHRFQIYRVVTQGVSSPRHDVEIGFQVGLVKGMAWGAVRNEDCRPVGPITLN